jgi:abortive infection bacteriophage resistance protein
MQKIPYTKPFLSYESQIALLKSRGMKFDDENKALHLLKNISYHRFCGYWYPLLVDKKNHIFKSNTNFETAFNLYKFDRELRKLIISELEKIEVAVRSEMAYLLSMTYGVFWMEDESLFANPAIHQAMLDKVNDELSRSDDDFILSFKFQHSNPMPPSFMSVEITSFGTLLRLYNNLLPGKMKNDIAKIFGLSDSVFASWLHNIISIRNICAHHERLWNRQLRIQPLFPRKPQFTWLTDKTIGNSRLFYTFSMIIYLLNIISPKHTFKQKLENLFLKYPNVDRAAMGFPTNWQSEPLWKNSKLCVL